MLLLVGMLFRMQFKNKPRDQKHITKSAYIPEEKSGIKNGDIIFQTSLSEQSKAIQLATPDSNSVNFNN